MVPRGFRGGPKEALRGHDHGGSKELRGASWGLKRGGPRGDPIQRSSPRSVKILVLA